MWYGQESLYHIFSSSFLNVYGVTAHQVHGSLFHLSIKILQKSNFSVFFTIAFSIESRAFVGLMSGYAQASAIMIPEFSIHDTKRNTYIQQFSQVSYFHTTLVHWMLSTCFFFAIVRRLFYERHSHYNPQNRI